MKHDVSDPLSDQALLLAQTRAAEVQARMSVLYCDFHSIDDPTAVEALGTMTEAIISLAEAVLADPANYPMVRRHLGAILDEAERETRNYIGLWQSTMDVLALLDFLDLAEDVTVDYTRVALAYAQAGKGPLETEHTSPRRVSRSIAA